MRSGSKERLLWQLVAISLIIHVVPDPPLLFHYTEQIMNFGREHEQTQVFSEVFFTLITIPFTVSRYHIAFLSNLKFKNQKRLKTPFPVCNIFHKLTEIAQTFISRLNLSLQNKKKIHDDPFMFDQNTRDLVRLCFCQCNGATHEFMPRRKNVCKCVSSRYTGKK